MVLVIMVNEYGNKVLSSWQGSYATIQMILKNTFEYSSKVFFFINSSMYLLHRLNNIGSLPTKIEFKPVNIYESLVEFWNSMNYITISHNI